MNIRLFIAIFCLIYTTNYSFSQETESSENPFEFSWPQETVLLTTGIAGQVIGQYRLTHMKPAGPQDLNRDALPVWDRPFAGIYSPGASLASDVLAVGTGGSAVFVGAWQAWRGGTSYQPVLEDFLILSEAFAWSSAVNLNVRAERLHPRPFVYGTEASASDRAKPEAAGSFYSGHASEAFLGAVYLATSYPLRHPEFEHRGWLWTGALAAATTTAALRVAAGKHFPSDVVAGAAMGSLMGLGFAQLHRPGGLGLWGAQLWPTLGEGGAPGLVAVRRF